MKITTTRTDEIADDAAAVLLGEYTDWLDDGRFLDGDRVESNWDSNLDMAKEFIKYRNSIVR